MKKITMIFCILFFSAIFLTVSCEEQSNAEASTIDTPVEPATTADTSKPDEVKATKIEIKQPAETEEKIEPAVSEQQIIIEQKAVETVPDTPPADNIISEILKEIADPCKAVIVTVNGQDITKDQLDALVLPNIQERIRVGQAPSEMILDSLKSRALDFLIGETVKTQEYEKHNITVSDEEIIAEINRVIGNMDPPTTVEDFNESLKMQGMSILDIKPMVAQDKKAEKLVKIKYPGSLDVNDTDAKTIYDQNIMSFQKPEQVRASHILIILDANLPADQSKVVAKQKIDTLLKQIKEEDADFAKLAKENSVDVLSAIKGGDLGFFDQRKMTPPFSQAAFAMQPGEISDVVETSYGYHIIKVTDRKAAYTEPFENVKEKIKDVLKRNKIQPLAQEILTSLKKNAEIVYPPDSDIRAYQGVSSTIREPQQSYKMDMGSTPK